jgi:hypothetical protein
MMVKKANGVPGKRAVVADILNEPGADYSE